MKTRYGIRKGKRSTNHTRYYIKSDCGYGDWSIVARDLTEKQLVEQFNWYTCHDFSTFDECYNCDHSVYSVGIGEPEENTYENWLSS